MKQIIINADDFGLTSGINRGIINAYKDGILTSASLLANGPQFNEAVVFSKENPGLGIGVHLNIFRGKPVSGKEKVPSLIDKNGYFVPSLGNFVIKSVLHKLKPDEIEGEFRSQINKIILAGILPSHLDTEKHLHVLPFIAKILFKLAEEFGIRKVRSLEPGFNLKQLLSIRRFIFYLFLLFTMGKRSKIKGARILMPERIYGLLEGGKMFQNEYIEIFKHMPDGCVEIVCHPGHAADISENLTLEMGRFYLNHSREKELAALLNPDLKNLADSLNIKLISYRGLN